MTVHDWHTMSKPVQHTVYAVSTVIADSGTPALESTPVVTTASLMAEAIKGCMVMVVVVVAVTVTGKVNGHPETGSHLIYWEGYLRNSRSADSGCGLSTRRASIPGGVLDTGT